MGTNTSIPKKKIEPVIFIRCQHNFIFQIELRPLLARMGARANH